MKLYSCCEHCDESANMCPNKHWYPCNSCKTVEVNRKYRPKFQWPLKLKDYGDESLK